MARAVVGGEGRGRRRGLRWARVPWVVARAAVGERCGRWRALQALSAVRMRRWANARTTASARPRLNRRRAVRRLLGRDPVRSRRRAVRHGLLPGEHVALELQPSSGRDAFSPRRWRPDPLQLLAQRRPAVRGLCSCSSDASWRRQLAPLWSHHLVDRSRMAHAVRTAPRAVLHAGHYWSMSQFDSEALTSCMNTERSARSVDHLAGGKSGAERTTHGRPRHASVPQAAWGCPTTFPHRWDRWEGERAPAQLTATEGS